MNESDTPVPHWMALALCIALTLFFMDAYFFPGAAVVIDIVVLLLALAGAFALRNETIRLARPDPVVVGCSVAGAAVGHALMARAGLHPALAGSLAGVVISVPGLLRSRRAGAWAVPFYLGAFAGTGSECILHGFWWVLLAGGLSGLLWSTFTSAWAGLGGKMGFTALIGAAVSVWISEWLAGNSPPSLPMQCIELGYYLAIPAAGLSAAITRLLQQRGMPAVAASAVPTACVSGLLFAADSAFAGPLAAAWYGGSFIGVTQPSRIQSLARMMVAGALFGVLVLRLQSTMIGWAGVLGSTALTCVLAMLGAEWLQQRVRGQRAAVAG